jgi:hypothetical protein
MSIDNLQHQIAILERDIADITHELMQVRRETVRIALDQELTEKRRQLAEINNQVSINMGEKNDFTGGNAIIGSHISGNVNQSNETINTSVTSSTFGGNSVIAGRDVHIYSNPNYNSDIVPIDVEIFIESRVYKKETVVEKHIAREVFTVALDEWNERANFVVKMNVKNSISKEIEETILFEGIFHLEDVAIPNRNHRKFPNLVPKFLIGKIYKIDIKDIELVYNTIVVSLSRFSRLGYDIDNEIIDFSKTPEQLHQDRYSILLQLYAYVYYPLKLFYKGFSLNLGRHKLPIFSKTLTRRKNA